MDVTQDFVGRSKLICYSNSKLFCQAQVVLLVAVKLSKFRSRRKCSLFLWCWIKRKEEMPESRSVYHNFFKKMKFK